MELRNYHYLAIILALCLLLFFPHLGALDIDIMEARNFISAREILESKNWLITTLNGELRLAKPPLPTWLTAIAALVTGDIQNPTILRIPAAVFATLMACFLYAFTKTISVDKKTPFFASLVACSSLFYIYVGRTGNWDIFCHAFMLGAIWQLSKGWKKQSTAYSEFTLAGMLMGSSFMSKGPVSFYALLLPFLLSYLFAFGFRNVVEKWRECSIAGILCLIISAAWPTYVFLHVPEALLNIAKTETGSWAHRSVRPFWYYWSFPIQAGLWVLPVLATLIFPYAKPRIATLGNYKFLLLWLIITVVLLSIVPEKKDRYLFPAIIPMSLLTGFLFNYLTEAFKNNRQSISDEVIFYCISGLIILITCTIPIYSYFLLFKKGSENTLEFIFLSFPFIILLLLEIAALKQKKFERSIYHGVALMALFTVLWLPHLPKLLIKNSEHRTLKRIEDHPEITGLPFYSIGEIRPEQIWAIGQKVPLWNYPNDRSPMANLPLALFSRNHPKELLSPADKEKLQLKVIATFDYGKRNPGDLLYITILKKN